MAASAKHTRNDVAAGGLALRAQGKEPTQAQLFNALGRTGHPKTIWRTWTEVVQAQVDRAPAPAGASAVPPMSAEMTLAHGSVQMALAGLVEQARREATAPLLAEIEALRAALSQARHEVSDRDEVIELQHVEIEALRGQIAGPAMPKRSLILRP